MSVDVKGLTLTNRRTGSKRLLTSDTTFALSWAPDSGSIAYIDGDLLFDVGPTGDLKVVSRAGRTRTLIRHDQRYGGQIVALTWARVPKGTTYRRPLVPGPGLFVGGPVARLSAGASRVAFAACARLYVWTPPGGSASEIARLASACLDPQNRTEYYDLAVAGSRIFWGEKTSGLSYEWSLHARTLSSGNSLTLTRGRGSLGCPYCDGAGALAAAGDLMVFGEWHTISDAATGQRVTTETLFRATDVGCPCTAIAYAAAPFTTAPLVPLDTDGSRVAALRYGSLVVVDSTGRDLLTSTLPAGGAQITGDALLVLVDQQLNQYDIRTGAFTRAYPLPAGAIGRDCAFYSEPHCPTAAVVKLQDAAAGLVAYTTSGQLHVLHLGSGADRTIGYASDAAFMDAGLVFADGARINYLSYSVLRAA